MVDVKVSQTKPKESFYPSAEQPFFNSGFYSPYYNETHLALREEVRAFVEEYIAPYADEWDETGEIDPNLYLEFGKRGYLCAMAGEKKWPSEYTDLRIKSVPPEKFDVFHEQIIGAELARGGAPVCWFLVGGYSISVPAIFKYGSEELKRRILPDILAGKKRCCLSITEPDAGSDVANLKAEAVKSEDGKYYYVTGTKKWITNGIFSDYFVAAVRTGGPGMGGISMLVVERSEDVSTRKIIVGGVRGSGTTLLNYEDAKVPVGNLLYKENQGFKCVVSNFNHERLGILWQVTELCRVLIEECFKWSLQRETFGQKLIEHAVIRNKIGTMMGRTEALSALTNDLTFQYSLMSDKQAQGALGGPIAAAKAVATQTLEYCAREATQIFGGLGYTRGGKGGKVERIYRDVRAYAIPGGSEEIMIDLAVRQGLKFSAALGANIGDVKL